MPCLVVIAQVVLEKTIFKYFQYNFTILQLSSLVEWRGPSFEFKDALCQIWLKLAQWF